MYRLDNFLSFVLYMLGIFFVFYGIMLFLPFLLLVVGIYVLYYVVKLWWFKRQLRESLYQFEFKEEKKEAKGNVIDAEFEILDEKTHE